MANVSESVLAASKKVHSDMESIVRARNGSYKPWDDYSSEVQGLLHSAITYYMHNPGKSAEQGYSERSKGTCHALWCSVGNEARIMERRCRAEALKIVSKLKSDHYVTDDGDNASMWGLCNG